MASEVVTRERSVLVVIDVQEKLMPAIGDGERILRRIDLLLAAARETGVPVLLTEQYPKGLGATLQAVRRAIPECDPVEKTAFSCALAPEFAERLARLGRDRIVLAGVEAHVCVSQTALDLAGRGMRVFVAADATGSRRPFDAETALRRLAGAGVTVTTAEAIVFEWLRDAAAPEFKALQPKLKELS